MKAIYAGTLVLPLVIGCAAGRAHAKQDGSGTGEQPVPEVEGVQVRVQEVGRDGSYPMPPDRDTQGRVKRVDYHSKLQLSFQTPTRESELAASPEWTMLTEALETAETLLRDFEQLDAAIRAMPPVFVEGETQAIQERQDAYNDTAAELDYLVFGRSLMRPDKPGFLSVTPEQQDEMLEAPDYYEQLGKLFSAKRDELMRKAQKFARDSKVVEVRVKALLDPEVGERQLLQVPGYYELDEETLAARKNGSAAEFAKLKAEYDAARKVAGMFEELKTKGPAALKQLKESVTLGIEQLADDFEQLANEWAKEAKQLATDPDWETGEPNVARKALKADLARMDAVVAEVERFTAGLRNLESAFRREGLDALLADQGVTQVVADADALVQLLQGNGTAAAPGVAQTLKSIATHLEPAIAESAEVLKTKAESKLKGALETVRAKRKQLLEGLPETGVTLAALQGAFQEGNRVLGGLVDGLGEGTGTQLPHPIDDLPPTTLDLAKNPVTDGDEVQLLVEFWDRGATEAPDDDRKLESFRYTSEVVKTGWIWSGDVIFTKPFAGADSLTANAAVSREYRCYDRDHPYSFWNRLDPRIGFHAAQLNFDPEETAEVGIGVNFSLWDGLLRGGVGYNLGASDDEEYWFLGFGLISALNSLKNLDLDGRSD